VVMQILAHGISAAGLFILCGEIAERLKTRDLRNMGGLWARFSNLPQFGLFFILASLGLPGLGNFLGEFLILLGTFKTHPGMAMLAAVGLVLSAVYSLILMQRAFYGKPAVEAPLADLDRREFAILSTLMAVMIWLGLYPRPFFSVSRAPTQALQSLYAPAVTQGRTVPVARVNPP
jgi:NADH-quinone oxidoreductase subunit M